MILRAKAAVEKTPTGDVPFPMQGDGSETRAFIYIDDFTDGLLRVIQHGKHNEIYHIGTDEEVPVRAVAEQVVALFGRKARFEQTPLQAGSTMRRCPNITKLRALGFAPKVSFTEGLKRTHQWYTQNAHLFAAKPK